MLNIRIRVSESIPGLQSQNCLIRKAVQPRKDLAFPIELFIPSDSMPLEGPDQLHLRAVAGYIELEMFEEANAELEEIDPFCPAHHLAVALICARLAHWSNRGFLR